MNKAAVVFTLMVLSTLAFAHGEMGENMKAPEELISAMMIAQNVSSAKEITCSKISNEEFEILGDAVMERMAGNHELHEQMDVMMGGEGSASLQQMHIVMGKNWLGCTSTMPMMGTNMMPAMMRMMGNYYPAYYSGYDAAVLAAVVGWVLFGITLYFCFAKQKKHRR